MKFFKVLKKSYRKIEGGVHRSLVRGINYFVKPAVAILYHRVTDLNNDTQMLAVSPDNFHDHLLYLKNNYNLLSIEDFIDIIESGEKSFPDKSVIITFDDGYADNHSKALPILESMGVQALFFIATGLIDKNREFWWDQLERVFIEGVDTPSKLTLPIQGKKCVFNTSTPEGRRDSFLRIHNAAKLLLSDQRDVLIHNIYNWAGISVIGRESHRVLSSSEIESMGKSNAAIVGCHTQSHESLSLLDYDAQLKEILDSKRRIEKILGEKAEYFSYPYGTEEDFNGYSVSAVKAIGFRAAFSNSQKSIRRKDNPYILSRCLVRNWNIEVFKEQMKLFFFR